MGPVPLYGKGPGRLRAGWVAGGRGRLPGCTSPGSSFDSSPRPAATSGDTVHLDAVLEYNQDPGLLNELLLYRLTLEAREAVEESDLSKREMIRRLETSPSQFYRLLDPTYYGKSVGQLLALFRILGMKVDVVVSPVKAPATGS